MKKNTSYIFLFGIAILIFSSCATIFTGGRQTIHFTSQPQGATVVVDGRVVCRTPCSAPIRRSSNETITFSSPSSAYADQDVRLNGYFRTGAFIGGLIFGGGIGTIIDLSSGALWEYRPARVSATFSLTDEEIERRRVAREQEIERQRIAREAEQERRRIANEERAREAEERRRVAMEEERIREEKRVRREYELASGVHDQMIDRGRVGNLTWTLEKIRGNITLSITGQGDMPIRPGRAHHPASFWPWYAYRSSIEIINIGNGVTSIGSNAFMGFTSLSSVSIPNTVRSIGLMAFHRTPALRSVTIPNSVRTIEGWAFRESGLTSVVIPNGITIIEDRVFEETPLTSVTIPNSVTTIRGGAFANTHLTYVVIPRSVTYIGGSAFRIFRLASVTVLNPRPPDLSIFAFFGVRESENRRRLYVPQEALLRYQLNDAWSRQFPAILAVE